MTWCWWGVGGICGEDAAIRPPCGRFNRPRYSPMSLSGNIEAIEMMVSTSLGRSNIILVLRVPAPFGQHQESRLLARSNDIPVLNGFVSTIVWDQNQSDLFRSICRMTGGPWIADFRRWARSEVAIFDADQKKRAASGDKNGANIRFFPVLKLLHTCSIVDH